MYRIIGYDLGEAIHGGRSAMSSQDLPPYFNISPDRALSMLGDPTSTEGLAQIAASYRRGRQDLVGRGLEENGDRKLRLFSTWEITRYLIPAASQHFRRVLR